MNDATLHFEKPIEELNLPEEIVQVLKDDNILTYDNLCCKTLGELKSLGLEPPQVSQILKVIRTSR
jgi:hypothetical protein